MIEKRTRYTIWDLLGDVGGFNDGLVLVLQILTSAYTAVSFKTQFLASVYYDTNSDARSRRNSHQYSSTIATITEPNSNRLDPAVAQSMFEQALQSASRLKQSFCSNLFLPWSQKRR